MTEVINLIIIVLIFCVIAYGLKWVCSSFGLPQPILWICGAILLIILLLFCANEFGGSGTHFHIIQIR